jgi:hypothetical protein
VRSEDRLHGGGEIQDEFSNLPISKQRRYQVRHQKAGLCTQCGERVVDGTTWPKHRINNRELARKTRKYRRRYYVSPGYRLQGHPRRKPAPRLWASMLLARGVKE